jgi:ketosteroid isomerase-like protein
VSLVLIIAALCAASLIGSDKTMSIDKEKEALLAVDSAFSALSVEKGRAAAFEEYLGEGAAMFRDNAHPFIGKERIQNLMARSPKGTLSWKPHFADVAESGDLGYTWGEWEYTDVTASGAETKSKGYYVTFWKKQADGKWKFVLDIGTSGPPLEEW